MNSGKTKLIHGIKRKKIALKQLSNNKSCDTEGLANDLFKEEAAGTDLLKVVLKLMNLMKEKQIYPKVLENTM